MQAPSVGSSDGWSESKARVFEIRRVRCKRRAIDTAAPTATRAVSHQRLELGTGSVGCGANIGAWADSRETGSGATGACASTAIAASAGSGRSAGSTRGAGAGSAGEMTGAVGSAAGGRPAGTGLTGSSGMAAGAGWGAGRNWLRRLHRAEFRLAREPRWSRQALLAPARFLPAWVVGRGFRSSLIAPCSN